MCVYIRYHHTLKWLCLSRLVVTSLRNYLQMHLMFLSNNNLQDCLCAGAYRIVIISVAAVHVDYVVIFSRHLSFHQKLSCSKQRSEKCPVYKQSDIQREDSNKKRKQTSSLSTKIYSPKITNFSNFCWSMKCFLENSLPYGRCFVMYICSETQVCW